VPNLDVPASEPQYSWPLVIAVLVPLLAAAGLLLASMALKALV